MSDGVQGAVPVPNVSSNIFIILFFRFFGRYLSLLPSLGVDMLFQSILF